MQYKAKMGPRKGQAPAITVPKTVTQVTYFNIPLVDYLQDKGFDRLTVIVDEVEKVIQLRKAREGQKGYKIVPTGRRGHGITPRLRELLPAGRYVLTDRRRMVFEKAV